jgi:hypothetical protein
MFKLQTSRETWLQIKIPDPDGEVRLKLKVKLVGHKENAAKKHEAVAEQVARLEAESASGAIDSAPAMLARFVALEEAISPEAIERNIDELVARVVDWQEVCDEDGTPLAYSADRLRSVLDMGTWVVKAVRHAILDLDDDGRRKN